MKVSLVKPEQDGYGVHLWFTTKKEAERFVEYLHQQVDYAIIQNVASAKKAQAVYEAIEEEGKEVPAEKIEEILFWIDYDATHDEMVLSPNKAGEITGKGGKQLQVKCKDGKIECYQSRIGYWYIPLRVVLEMM